MSTPLPVTIVTGFLGAGKTTLVNHWLAQIPTGDVAVIVNEQGAIGIDAELLAGRARTIVEISGGCVCCATQAELIHALDAFAASAAPPKRILLETSGAASPAGVLRALVSGGTQGAFALDGVITVVDATRPDVLQEHDLALEQLGYADIVVLSRADTCSPEVLTRSADELARYNGAAVFVEAARGVSSAATSLDALLALRHDTEFAGLREPPPVQLAHVYESVSLSIEGEVDGEHFADFIETELAAFAGRIFRTKGILAVSGLDERMIVQGVTDAVEVSFGQAWADAPRRSRLVIVGFGLDRAALARGFAACAVSD